MGQGRETPWIAITIAVISAVAAVATDLPLVLGIALLILWIGSLYLVPIAERVSENSVGTDSVTVTQSGIANLIENSGLALLLIDRDRIALANASAREALGAHIVGQDPRVAFRHPAAIDLLEREEGGDATIHGLSGPKSSWHMRRQQVDQRYWIIELVDRSAENDLSRAHTDFVANASHELRTPLASIIGYIETLSDEGADVDPAMAAKFHQTVLREARRLQALVSDLLSLSRVEAEKHEAPRERVDLGALVRRAATDAAGTERQGRLQFNLPSDRMQVRAAPEQLEQLVRNIVDNALKYGADETPVEISLREGKRRMAELQVVDHGEGIASEHLPHLTRRFYRTDPGRSRAAGGTGLGLAIVKHIVERHRGRMDISSELGVGTKVAIRLPLAR